MKYSAGNLIRLCGVLVLLGLLVLQYSIAATGNAVSSTPRHTWHAERPDKLWKLIHRGCVPAAKRDRFPPMPCTEVDASRDGSDGYVVFKDRAGRYQYLVLPTARITGIESHELLAIDAPNYFADAWTARLYVEAALHAPQPRDVISLVVNSAYGRTQNQLHIHVDCIRPDVHAALRRLLPMISSTWQPLEASLPPNGHRYQAMWIGGRTLHANPFKLLASALPAGDEMARHSLILVGAYSPGGKPGFILLSGHVDPASHDRGNGDALQDLGCVLATGSDARR
jgi:CDP-diacylglycerol pyrophosphatase